LNGEVSLQDNKTHHDDRLMGRNAKLLGGSLAHWQSVHYFVNAGHADHDETGT
jgi:hypothetical protein